MKSSAPPSRSQLRKAANLARARELVLRFGWNATAYQILQPGLRWWFSREGDAVIGYARRHGVRMVAGAPVCAHERLPAVIIEWEAHAGRSGDRVCYFGAGHRLLEVLAARQERGEAIYDHVLLGAQPIWRPTQWPALVRKQASLRSQIQRARNKEVQISHYVSASTCSVVQTPDAVLLEELRAVLRVWLDGRGLPTLHFLVEPQLLPRLEDRQLFVARRENRVVAYLVLTPVPARRGWLVEQIARLPEAPNGTTELLIDSAMRAAADEGCDYFTLGLTPLWQPENWHELPRHAPWLRLVLGWLRVHGQRFYNFDGLRAFKTKLQPHDWEPIYAISNERHLSPRTLLAFISAFSDQAPLGFGMLILIRAAREEWRRWRTRSCK